MVKALFNGLFKFLITITKIFLLPVDLLVTGIFPDFSEMLSNFNNLVNIYIGNGLSYFGSILPPTVRSMIVLYISLLIIFYTVSFSVHGILKVINIIKNIKIW